ncbi:MAG: cell wall hydrolase [Polymorphobacter sp.]
MATPTQTPKSGRIDTVGGVRLESPTPAESVILPLSPPAFWRATSDDRRTATDCLARAIGYEAGNEPDAGKAAVAQVILNRVRHRAFPKTVCNVVYQGSGRRTGCQFTFTCDGSLRRVLSRRSWASAQAVAQAALDGLLPDTVGSATHYHADYVAPRWAPSLHRIGQIGAHIFYRFPGAGDDNIGNAITATTRTDRRRLPAPTAAFMVWGLAPAGSDTGNLDIKPGAN